jgi:hypothetical protein
MTLDEFNDSLSQTTAPANLSVPLQALWQEAKGDWDFAHRLVQVASDRDSAWVHAYLHRKEGDLSNAAYWYSCARRSMPNNLSLEQEWKSIVQALL